MSAVSSRLGLAGRIAKEACAILFWVYVFARLFDFDVKYGPGWVHAHTLLVVAAAMVTLWLVLRTGRFLRLVTFVVTYPFVILLWHIPRLALRRWTVLIVFAPAVQEILGSLRPIAFFYTGSAISAAIILHGSDDSFLVGAMVFLGVFLVAHLTRSFRRAYKSRFLKVIADVVRRLRQKLEAGVALGASPTKAAASSAATDPETARRNELSVLYVMNWGSEYFADKLREIAKRRTPDLYLIACWLWTVLVTCVTYGFEYLALHKIDPTAFSAQEGAGFWSFLGLSFGKLIPTSVSKIEPISTAAALLCYAEGACALAIFVILIFVVLTAARERYHEDIAEVEKELRDTAVAVQRHAERAYAMAFGDIEIIVLVQHRDMVNRLRRLRELPELVPPPSSPEKT